MITHFKSGDIVVRVARDGQPLAPGAEIEVKVVEKLSDVQVKLAHPVPQEDFRFWGGGVKDHEWGFEGWSGAEFATASGVLFQDGTEGLIQDFALALDHFHATRKSVATVTRRNRALYQEVLEKEVGGRHTPSFTVKAR